MAEDTEATIPPAAPEAATLTPARGPFEEGKAPPGYEILGELGRGGMGVVYKARQKAADRLCALKMILSGSHAGEADLARFQTEAQAIARLQHPNIVQVFDVGAHEGRPFFSLELCSGGSLEGKLAGTPLPPSEAARLVRILAEAMQAAHDAKVVHRDLKPANILLMADGTPKVTDFGLAKKLDEVGQTQTGNVMGTPSYMAPEQAEGKKDIGPLADVYALGAILYDCLTGRPPFRAATAFDTIMQVVSEEPVPPRALNAAVPRDLETICLKCLAKEPGRRYGSAKGLADDLGRWLAGEPILARPAGMLERAAKWVRRNRAVSALMAGMAVALVAAGLLAWTASSALALARQRAEDEAKANSELLLSQDRLLTSVARSILRPLGLESLGTADRVPLRIPEVEALKELASSAEPKLRLRFVKEAIRDGAALEQFRYRAAPALQAAIGLDQKARGEALAVLLDALDAEKIPWHEAAALAACIVDAGPDAESARRARGRLLSLMAKAEDALSPCLLAEIVGKQPGPSDPAEAASLAAKAGEQPLAVLRSAAQPGHVSGGLVQQSLRAVQALAGRMDQAAAAKAWAVVAKADIDNPEVGHLLLEREQALTALAGRLSPAQAAEAAGPLATAIEAAPIPPALVSPCRLLGILSARMEPAKYAVLAARAAKRILADLEVKPLEGADFQAVNDWSRAAAGLVPRMPPADGSAFVARCVVPMIAALDGPGKESLEVARAIPGLAAWLRPAEAAKAAEQVLAKMSRRIGKDDFKGRDDSADRHLLPVLEACLRRMEAKASVALSAKTYKALVGPVADGGGGRDRHERQKAEWLAAISGRMAPADAGAAAEEIVANLPKLRSSAEVAFYSRLLSSLLARIPEAARTRLGDQAVRAFLANPGEKEERQLTCFALAMLADSLSPTLAKRAKDRILSMAAQQQDPWLCQALAAFAPRMNADEAVRAARAAFIVLACWSNPEDAASLPAYTRTILQREPPLPAQALADLLKHPLCIGEARASVLAQLSRHYNRPFADQWEFASYAEGEKLPLELASPWKPPATAP